MKVCSKCLLEKALSEFSPRKPSGYRSWCKPCCRAWYAENREKLLPYKAKYYQDHKDECKAYPSQAPDAKKAYGIKYRAANKEKTVARNKKFRHDHPSYMKDWVDKTRSARREYHRNWCRKQRKDSIAFRILDNTRRRIRSAIEGKTKSLRTLEILGCDVDALKSHLEAMFEPEMTWSNYGDWEIDHIVPCALFDLSVESELLRCFHFSNLQPLWKSENRNKSDSIGIAYG